VDGRHGREHHFSADGLWPRVRTGVAAPRGSGEGLPFGPIEVISGSARTAVIADPEGNSITFGQPLP